ncbi:MAG: PAS domain-containing protein, partial [Desulfatiglandales bacterium]
ESEERYRTLVQNVPIGVYRTTPGAKGKFLIANPAFLKMFGFDSEEELKKIALADVCVNPEQRKVFSDNFLAKGSASGQELPLRRKDGTVFWGSVTARVVYDKNRKNPYFDCTIMDITERRKAEEEQRRLIKDLEETNKIMVGRELRMIELKEEVNKLSKELGRPEPYDVLLEKSQKSK